MKNVIIDQGSVAEIMYLDLYRGLGLKPENLTAYNSPLVSFKGKMVVPKGQIRLPVQIGLDMVEVNFIVVDVFFSLHGHYGQTLASHLGGCFLHSSPEGEISLRGPSAEDIMKPICS